MSEPFTIEFPPESDEQRAARERASKLMDDLQKHVSNQALVALEKDAENRVRIIAQEEALRVLKLGMDRFSLPAITPAPHAASGDAHAVHVEAYRSGRRIGLLDARLFIEQRSARLGTTYEQKVALVSVLADINSELDRSDRGAP